MQLQGKFEIPTGVDKVYNFISDPAQIIQCVPGLQDYKVGENKRISASVKVSFGFIRSVFQATSKVVKEDPVAHTATLELNGSGSGSGFNGLVDIVVKGSDATSEVSWSADVNVSGPLGSLAKPLIQGTVKKMVDDLFGCVKAKLS
jgi:uncharacterized protein